MKKKRLVLVLPLLLLSLTGCNDNGNNGDNTIIPTEKEFVVNCVSSLKVNEAITIAVFDNETQIIDAIFESSNTLVATVSSYGEVKALSQGRVKISISKTGYKTSEVTIEVSENVIADPDDPVKPDPDEPINPDDPVNPTDPDSKPLPGSIKTITGLEDAIQIKGHYFNPFKGVKVISSTGLDITSYLNVLGNVNYGVEGKYKLTYSIDYNNETYSKERTISIENGTYNAPINNKKESLKGNKVIFSDGSYRINEANEIRHPNLLPTYIENDLLDKPIPTNGWWTTLLTSNYGGGNYNGGGNCISLNPLRSSLSRSGVEVTDLGEGFTEYHLQKDTNPNYRTQTQFTPFFQDLMIKSKGLKDDFVTSVIDYTDNNCKVALRNNKNDLDKMIVTYTSGSPYVFTEVDSADETMINIDSRGGPKTYNFYDTKGNVISGSSYTGDGIVINLVGRHSGYITNYESASVGGGVYSDAYFLVSTPKNTTFTLNSGSGVGGAPTKSISIKFNNGNYFSTCSMKSLDEINIYHDNAYAFMGKSNISYDVDHLKSKVNTTFRNNIQIMDGDYKNNRGLLTLLPHQSKYINDASNLLSTNSYRSIRGIMRLLKSNTFDTSMSFNGVLPSFTLPSNSEFSNSRINDYLKMLDDSTNQDLDKVYEENNDKRDYINSLDPYWNSKVLYPMSQALIISSQVGNKTYKTKFLNKLELLLSDWFTFSDNEVGNSNVHPNDVNNKIPNGRYFYYNDTYGTLYPSVSGFGVNTELSDHHFTYGYLSYAAGVVAMYDSSFFNKYDDMITSITKDYMNPNEEDERFPVLRGFDGWSGHSWAHGYGNFNDGNNQESTSEAINSWVGGYLVGLAKNDKSLIDAAIYGYTFEFISAKEYNFNYSGTNWLDSYKNHASVASLLWGTKIDYATWFGANPVFIYGIQWLPTGEYLTNYASDEIEKNKLKVIYNNFLNAYNNLNNTWYSNTWSIESIIDPDSVLDKFDETKILNDDYPNELLGCYYMINALKTLKNKDSSIYMEINNYCSSSMYNDGNNTYAMIWNVSSKNSEVIFHKANETIKKVVAASSFTKIKL